MNQRPDTDDAIDELRGQVEFLIRSDEATQEALRILRKGNGGGKDLAARASELQTWLCPKCGSRAGLYDPRTDEMAIRVKDSFLWLQTGVGGWVEVACRGCAFRLRLDYEPAVDASPEELAAIEVIMAARARRRNPSPA